MEAWQRFCRKTKRASDVLLGRQRRKVYYIQQTRSRGNKYIVQTAHEALGVVCECRLGAKPYFVGTFELERVRGPFGAQKEVSDHIGCRTGQLLHFFSHNPTRSGSLRIEIMLFAYTLALEARLETRTKSFRLLLGTAWERDL